MFHCATFFYSTFREIFFDFVSLQKQPNKYTHNTNNNKNFIKCGILTRCALLLYKFVFAAFLVVFFNFSFFWLTWILLVYSLLSRLIRVLFLIHFFISQISTFFSIIFFLLLQRGLFFCYKIIIRRAAYTHLILIAFICLHSFHVVVRFSFCMLCRMLFFKMLKIYPTLNKENKDL